MRLCVATYSTGKFESVRQLTEPNKREYCERHGYDFQANEPTQADSTASFDRYAWYVELLDSGRWEYLYCLDSDAIFTNMAKPLASMIQPTDALIFPVDAVTVQTGGFICRCSNLTRFFFMVVLLHRASGCRDQHVVGALLPLFRGRVRFSPQREFGSYDYFAFLQGHAFVSRNYAEGRDYLGNDGQWQPGDLILHVPGMPVEKKVEALRPYLDKVRR